MTLEMLVAAVGIGLSVGALAGRVISRSSYGLIGDLAIGLAGGTAAPWIFRALGIAPYENIVATMVVAFLGATSLIVAERKLWNAPA
jgi:uncharacterized membrane protein YeaQ/YmgE (transglycosylase-associated protein family)